jgi:uncharacterized phiE125 gp8 family phage protein
MNQVRSTIEVVSSPAYEPVSRAEAKRWLRIDEDDTAHDLVVDLLIKAMREDAEHLTGRAFISRQLRLYLEQYPSDRMYGSKIVLPHPPVISVDSFKYIDTDGVLQTLATTEYEVQDAYEPAFIIPAHQVTWPSIRVRPNALQIVFTAGYQPGSPSDAASNQEVMPASLRLWMESKIATHNEFREQVVAGAQVFKIPRDFTDGLLDPLVIGSRLF